MAHTILRLLKTEFALTLGTYPRSSGQNFSSVINDLTKINSLRLGDLGNTDEFAMRPGRYRQVQQRLRQYLSGRMCCRNQMRNRAVRAAVYGKATSDLAEHRDVVVPVHRVSALRIGWATPVFNGVKIASVGQVVPEVGDVQHGCG